MVAACSATATLETVIPPGSEAVDSRILGTWEIADGPEVTSHATVTQEAGGRYMIRVVPVETDRGESAAVFMGRLGTLGSRRLVLEFSPVGDTTKFTTLPDGRDSTRLRPPLLPLMLPYHMHLVLTMADTGIVLSAFNGDSLLSLLEAGRLRGDHADLNGPVLLTGTDPVALNALLRAFAGRPGALVVWRRVGRRITLPRLDLPPG